MPFIVATYVYSSSQGQRTHSARTNKNLPKLIQIAIIVPFDYKSYRAKVEQIIKGEIKLDSYFFHTLNYFSLLNKCMHGCVYCVYQLCT